MALQDAYRAGRALALALVLGLSACGGAAEPSDTTTTADASQTPSPAPVEAPAAIPQDYRILDEFVAEGDRITVYGTDQYAKAKKDGGESPGPSVVVRRSERAPRDPDGVAEDVEGKAATLVRNPDAATEVLLWQQASNLHVQVVNNGAPADVFRAVARSVARSK